MKYYVGSICQDTQDRLNASMAGSSLDHTMTQRTHNTQTMDVSFGRKEDKKEGEQEGRMKGKFFFLSFFAGFSGG